MLLRNKIINNDNDDDEVVNTFCALNVFYNIKSTRLKSLNLRENIGVNNNNNDNGDALRDCDALFLDGLYRKMLQIFYLNHIIESQKLDV